MVINFFQPVTLRANCVRMTFYADETSESFLPFFTLELDLREGHTSLGNDSKIIQLRMLQEKSFQDQSLDMELAVRRSGLHKESKLLVFHMGFKIALPSLQPSSKTSIKP